jgi:rubredoxin
MAQIAAYDDVRAGAKTREVEIGQAIRTEFLCPELGNKSDPHAFLAERTANGIIRPHYHDVDQFQIVVTGGGTFGKHELAMHTVHFARAYTPYGPIIADQRGLGFLTLRKIRAEGFFALATKKEELKRIPNRKPWQKSEQPVFEGVDAVTLHPFSHIRDENGLAAYSLKLKPNAKAATPDASRSDGQYLIITKGSLNYDGKEHKAITIVFVRPDEKPFQMVAGAEGLEALVLNFPRDAAQSTGAQRAAPAAAAGLRVWQCQLCSFMYDEAQGMPEEGISAGTRWEDVPESWACPDCSATKSDFVMEVVA